MKFLMCVGAEKAGTTWLYEYFKNHPEFCDIGKELNIIQRDDMVPCLEDVAEYRKDLHDFFLEVSMLEKVTGDFTHYEGSSENIYRLFKEGLEFYDIEIIPVYIMRDPASRAWSCWNMLGGGNIQMPQACKRAMRTHLSCKYKETIQALDNVFAKPLYFFYEDFFTQNNVDKICDALGIVRHPAECDKIVNALTYSQMTRAFRETFGKSEKNKEAVKYIIERFEDVPWKVEDYI
jgi:hypothetical protein